MPEQQTDVVVIGAGITGLAAAHWLAAKNHDVRVLESAPAPGGVIETRPEDGFLFEYGPLTVLATHPEVLQLIDEAGLTDRIVWADKTSSKRFIVRDERNLPGIEKIGRKGNRRKIGVFGKQAIDGAFKGAPQ